MSSTLKLVTKLALIAGLAISLGFGATEAVACTTCTQPPPTECENEPPDFCEGVCQARDCPTGDCIMDNCVCVE